MTLMLMLMQFQLLCVSIVPTSSLYLLSSKPALLSTLFLSIAFTSAKKLLAIKYTFKLLTKTDLHFEDVESYINTSLALAHAEIESNGWLVRSCDKNNSSNVINRQRQHSFSPMLTVFLFCLVLLFFSSFLFRFNSNKNIRDNTWNSFPELDLYSMPLLCPLAFGFPSWFAMHFISFHFVAALLPYVTLSYCCPAA